MERRDNYAIQARDAKRRFLTYDQQHLADKFGLVTDESYLYVTMLSCPYRICRKTGDLQREKGGIWISGNSFGEVLTLFDMLCDGDGCRYFSGQWRSMQDFGLMFHQNLAEDRPGEAALRFDREPELLHRGCRALGGQTVSGADISYRIELFEGLQIWLQFWHGDEEFAPRLRYLWDAQAIRYIRYETMYYAVGLLLERIVEAA